MRAHCKYSPAPIHLDTRTRDPTAADHFLSGDKTIPWPRSTDRCRFAGWPQSSSMVAAHGVDSNAGETAMARMIDAEPGRFASVMNDHLGRSSLVRIGVTNATRDRLLCNACDIADQISERSDSCILSRYRDNPGSVAMSTFVHFGVKCPGKLEA